MDTIEMMINVTIADGNSLSDVVDLGDCAVSAVEVPAGFEGSALTFQAGSTTETSNLYDESGLEVNFTAGAGRYISLSNLALLHGLRYLKVRSGTAASPSAQSGSITLKLYLVAL